MTMRLTKFGDQMGLLLDQTMLDEFGIDEDTQFLVSTSEGRIMLLPIRFARTAQVEALTGKIMQDHSETLKRLAE